MLKTLFRLKYITLTLPFFPQSMRYKSVPFLIQNPKKNCTMCQDYASGSNKSNKLRYC